MSELNFRIVDGEYDGEEKYEQFKDYYLNRLDLTVGEICRTLNLTTQIYSQFLQRLHSETDYRRKKRGIGGEVVLSHEKYYDSKYGQFKELYSDVSISVDEIKQKLNIGRTTYNQLRDKFIEEYGVVRSTKTVRCLRKIKKEGD